MYRCLFSAGPLFSLLLFILSLGLPALPAHALPPQRFIIEETALKVQENMLTFFCSLSVDEETGLHALLKDGAVLELRIQMSLERHRPWWTNRGMADQSYVSLLSHDPLSREFMATPMLPENTPLSPKDITRDKNLTRLLHHSWRDLALPVIPFDAVTRQGPDREYLLSATFSLRHTEVPPWLEKSLLFWSSEVLAPETLTLKYFYMPKDTEQPQP